MTHENRISAELSDADMEKIRKHAQGMEDIMPWLVNVTAEERQTMPKAADKTISFVNKALDHSQHNPQFVPPFLDVTEFNKDTTLSERLLSSARPLRMLVEKMENSAMLASSEAYQAALLFYQSVKAAAKMGVPGAQTIYEDLRGRFPGRPSKTGNGAATNGKTDAATSGEVVE